MVGGSGAAGLRSISLRLIFLCRCFIHIFSSLSPSSNTIAETITHTISFFPHSPWIRAAFERETVSTKFKRGRLWAILPEYYIIVPQWSFIVTLTQQRERERDARERRRRVSPNSVHVSGPNCFAFYAFRFAIPFSFLDVVDHRFSRGYNARFDLVKDHGRVDPWKASVSPKRK